MFCLLVTRSKELSKLLRGVGVENVAVRESEEEARRLLEQQTFDFVALDTPLKDAFGCEFAMSLSDFYEMPVLVICDADLYESTREKLKEKTVFILQKPFTMRMLQECVGFIGAHKKKCDALMAKNQKLNKKLEDIKTIDRAKYLLMSYLNMSEPDAHRYIEKQAMDSGVSRRVVADNILKTYI